MPTLSDALIGEAKREKVVEECLTLIDEEVADKGGLSGLAIKAGYKTVKGLRPGFLRKVVHDLVPEFATALEPLYQEAVEKNEPVGGYMQKHSGRAADALLAITDGKARRSTNRIVKGTYDRLRGTAKKNVEAAIPRLSRLIERHTA